MSELEGKVALVTGAARNIGRAITVDLARSGARIVVNARGSADEAEETARAVREVGGQAVVHMADVTDQASVDRLIAAAAAAFGGLDILVNNAAVRRETPLERLELAEWREVLGVILDGAYLCSRAALPYLRRSGAGSIVNIGGMSAHTGSVARAHVITAKTGLIGLTRALAHELAPDITVNCVVPGLIDTVRKASSTSGGTPALHGAHKTLVGRRGRPDEIASAVSYFCSPGARYVTGQTLHVNGGAYLP